MADEYDEEEVPEPHPRAPILPRVAVSPFNVPPDPARVLQASLALNKVEEQRIRSRNERLLAVDSRSPPPSRLTSVSARLEHPMLLRTVQELFWFFDFNDDDTLDLSEFTRLVRALMEVRDWRSPSPALASATANEIATSFQIGDAGARVPLNRVNLNTLMINATMIEGPFNSLLAHADLEARSYGMTLTYAVKSRNDRSKEAAAAAALGGFGSGGGGGGRGGAAEKGAGGEGAGTKRKRRGKKRKLSGTAEKGRYAKGGPKEEEGARDSATGLNVR